MALANVMTGKRTVEYDPYMDALLKDKFDGDVTRFARTADLSYSQAHDIMVNGITDGRRLSTLRKIAGAFGMSVGRLVSGK